MRTRFLWTLVLLLSVVIAVLVFIRPTAHEYVQELSRNEMRSNSDWGNYKILEVENHGSYAVVRIEYQTKPNFIPQERWFIKDNKKVTDKGTGYPLWKGNVYLVRKRLLWWQEIR